MLRVAHNAEKPWGTGKLRHIIWHVCCGGEQKNVENCHKGKWKMQHQPNGQLGTREWEATRDPPLLTGRKKSKQVSSPRHSQIHRQWSAGGAGGRCAGNLPVSLLSLNSFTPALSPYDNRRNNLCWLTGMPTTSGWCTVHPSSLGPHNTSGCIALAV